MRGRYLDSRSLRVHIGFPIGVYVNGVNVFGLDSDLLRCEEHDLRRSQGVDCGTNDFGLETTPMTLDRFTLLRVRFGGRGDVGGGEHVVFRCKGALPSHPTMKGVTE